MEKVFIADLKLLFRILAISEIVRCLRSGGRACITVWSLEQTKDDVVSDYLKMRSNKTKVQVRIAKKNFFNMCC